MTKAPSSHQPRRAFEGMWKIVLYNWPKYALSGFLIALITTCLLYRIGGAGFQTLILGVLVCTVWWTTASLAASHWIYDKSELYQWTWIPSRLRKTPVRWLNLHSGLDESTPALRRMLEGTVGTIADFYHAEEMTESSIKRARDEAGETASIQIRHDKLPFSSNEFDAVFLLFAAHELRRAASRDAFFAEIKRVLASDGEVLVVEHLRDVPNFAVFGPGYLHFLPRTEWIRVFGKAGFTIRQEMAMTPFVRIFLLQH